MSVKMEFCKNRVTPDAGIVPDAETPAHFIVFGPMNTQFPPTPRRPTRTCLVSEGWAMCFHRAGNPVLYSAPAVRPNYRPRHAAKQAGYHGRKVLRLPRREFPTAVIGRRNAAAVSHPSGIFDMIAMRTNNSLARTLRP